jgi:antitoxin (DNA-binding transcriptional repressor) of toxin-antitoxin stability system
MQTTLAVEDIKVTLPELLDGLMPGDELILTRNRQPVAKLVSERAPVPPKQRPQPGLGKSMITFIAPDFDAPLDCMTDYMS